MKKKMLVLLLTASASLASLNVNAEGVNGNLNRTTVVTPSTEQQKAVMLITRLQEIDAMDRTGLTHSEKRELRKEVRSIDKQLREISGGVYLSTGAIIIIILLLILIL